MSLTIGQAAKKIGVSRQRLHQLIGEGRVDRVGFRLVSVLLLPDDFSRDDITTKPPGRPRKTKGVGQ